MRRKLEAAAQSHERQVAKLQEQLREERRRYEASFGEAEERQDARLVEARKRAHELQHEASCLPPSHHQLHRPPPLPPPPHPRRPQPTPSPTPSISGLTIATAPDQAKHAQLEATQSRAAVAAAQAVLAEAQAEAFELREQLRLETGARYRQEAVAAKLAQQVQQLSAEQEPSVAAAPHRVRLPSRGDVHTSGEPAAGWDGEEDGETDVPRTASADGPGADGGADGLGVAPRAASPVSDDMGGSEAGYQIVRAPAAPRTPAEAVAAVTAGLMASM